VWPDYARGGESCSLKVDGGVPIKCRECGDDVCDGDSSDDSCFHSDNVLNAVHPGDGAQYRWDIDEDGTHHTGLQWFHPHIHGTTAIQVASGAAGVWIIRGPLDALPGVANARERVMMFNTPPLGDNGFVPLEDGQDCTEDTLTFNNFATLGAVSAQQLNVLNGLHVPRMITPPGQVERWRIVHAGFLDEVWLGMFRGTDSSCSDFSTADADTLKLTQIGRDGLIMPQPFEHEHFFMSPGYRVEGMIGGEGKLKDGETWCLVAARFLQPSGNPELPQPSGPPTPPTQEDILARFDTNGSVVAVLNVSANAGAPTETQLPDYNAIGALAPSLDLDGVTIEQRCAAAADDTAPTEIDQAAVLQVGFFTTDEPDPCDCEGYNVNCANFESANRERYPVDRDLPLGAVEH
jgi:FtsP/CotA-like multicopper oxidase with cupredoxin domain